MSALPSELVDARDQVRDELRRADSKATTLLSLVGASLAGVIALSQREAPGATQMLLWTSGSLIFAAVLVLLNAVRPRLAGDPVPGTWLHAAKVGPATLLESCGAETAVDDATTASATHVCRLAQIAWAKFRSIQVGVTLLGCGLCVLAVSLLVGAVAS